MRSSGSDLNGMPQLQTPVGGLVLQASLQHVVLTYDPINGRQIFVNGQIIGVTDPQKGGTISNWDDTFALVLGTKCQAIDPGKVSSSSWPSTIGLDGGTDLAELQRGRRSTLLPVVQRRGRDRRAAGLCDVHCQSVRQRQLFVHEPDVRFAGSDRYPG